MRSILLLSKLKKGFNILTTVRLESSTSKMQSLCAEESFKIHPISNDKSLHAAKDILISGNVISLPTDTVYGLACIANNEAAVEHLYRIKGRNFNKPVAICVKDIKTFRRYGQADHLNDELLQRLLPGPITIIVNRSKHLNNPHLNPSTNKIGIRIPDFGFIQKLCELCGEQPLALTSANRSASPSSLNIYEFRELWSQLEGIFDAGPIGLSEEHRLASTVIDLAESGQYSVVREGVALQRTLKILHDFGLNSHLSQMYK